MHIGAQFMWCTRSRWNEPNLSWMCCTIWECMNFSHLMNWLFLLQPTADNIPGTHPEYPQPPGEKYVYFDRCVQYVTYHKNIVLETMSGFPWFRVKLWHVLVGTIFTQLNVFSYFARFYPVYPVQPQATVVLQTPSWGAAPVLTTCPSCNHHGCTMVEYTNGCFSIIAASFLCGIGYVDPLMLLFILLWIRTRKFTRMSSACMCIP